MMRGSSAWREAEWGDHRLAAAEIRTMAIYAGGPKLQVHRLMMPAFTLLGAKFLKHGYIIHSVGGYNPRPITGGTSWSSHSWGISGDFNEATNPYRTDRRVTDMPQSMVEDIYTIRNIDGVQIFRWGGDWDGRPETPNSNYDAMHYEGIATPEELERGFSIEIPSGGAAAPITHYPVIRINARGPIVLELQRLLGMTGTSGDGVFGPRTQAAVIKYQESRGLIADGIVGLATWTALITAQPALAAGAISPRKLII